MIPALGSSGCLFDEEDRDRLLEQLSDHLDQAGFGDFVAAPVLEPSDRCFPDPYVHGPSGVRTVARRLLRHAGLDLDVDVVADVSLETGPRHDCELTAIDEAGCALVVHQLGPPEDLPAALAQSMAWVTAAVSEAPEGAHPYRDPAFDSHREDLDPSILAFCYGFGLLVAQGAHRYYARGYLDGAYAVTEWAHVGYGSLEPEEACYLLAVQAEVRGIARDERSSWRRHLGSNERALFDRFGRELAGRADVLRDALCLPPPSAWPPPIELDVEPLRDCAGDELVIDEDVGSEDEAPLPVLRRWGHSGLAFAMYAVIVSLASFCLTLAVPEGLRGSFLATMIVLPLPAYLLGRLVRRSPECSRCERALPAARSECAGCRGRVLRDLAPGESHLEAHDALEDQLGVAVDAEWSRFPTP